MLWLVVAALPRFVAGQARPKVPYYVHEDYVVPESERTPAVERLEEKIASFQPNSTVGLVMFTVPGPCRCSCSLFAITYLPKLYFSE